MRTSRWCSTARLYRMVRCCRDSLASLCLLHSLHAITANEEMGVILHSFPPLSLQLAVLVAALPDCKPSPCMVQSHFPPRNVSTSSSGAPNTPSSNFLLITGADLTRASRVTIHQDVLSTYHWPQKSADELVYLLKFDYDFSGIPDANGPIYMRADVTDMPDYWDNIIELGVAAAPLQRRCARCGGRI
ncbi:hypothetical protein C8R44DRAFT_166938 [Mycena epipterygia]|nr:hypothetical protein C8R44DRAFT_166938 [Mycena epipterygia]